MLGPCSTCLMKTTNARKMMGTHSDSDGTFTQEQLDAAVEAERERCACVAWGHFMDMCVRTGRAPAMWSEWCAASAVRGTKE